LIHFCFKLAGVVFVTVALHAADSGQQYERITSVVRVDAHSGKLVRSVIVTPKAVTQQRVEENVILPRVVSSVPVLDAAPATAGIDDAVAQIAAQHDLNADLLHAVIKVESNYNPFAVSNKGALGLMQLIPATARRFGVSNVFNPIENIQGGARYLRYLLDLYQWNYSLALAAYNAGEAAVAKYGGVPPYRETQNYLNLVGRQLSNQKAKRAAGPQRAVAAKPAETSDEPAHIQQVVDPDGSMHYVSR
jgi:soluble lytic murein transglycosylase-like protein